MAVGVSMAAFHAFQTRTIVSETPPTLSWICGMDLFAAHHWL